MKSVIRALILILSLTSLTARAQMGGTPEKSANKKRMVEAWVEFKYSGCQRAVPGLLNRDEFEFISELYARKSSCPAKEPTSNVCFKAMDDILSSAYSPAIQAMGCEASPQYKKYLKEGQPPAAPEVYAVNIACDPKETKMNFQTGSDWCKQKISCKYPFQVNGKIFSAGSYNVHCLREEGRCPESYVSCTQIGAVQKLGLIYNDPLIDTSSPGAQ